MRWGRALALAATLGSALGCTTDPPTDPLLPVVEVLVTGGPADGIVILGSARQLVAEARGPGGAVLDGRAVAWQSSAPAVATVSGDGIVETLSAGTALIRAISEGVVASVSIEVREGASVPATGTTTVSVLGGLLRLVVPSTVAPAGTNIYASVASTWPADDRLLAGTVVELAPLNTQLSAGTVAGITFVPADVAAVERPNLRLFTVQANGSWGELGGGAVDLPNNRVSGSVMRLSTIAIFRRATPTQLVKLAGDGQTVTRNTNVPILPSVAVRDAAGRPVSGITVTFTTGATGGQLNGGSTATSGLDGVATIPGQWRMGSQAGTYTLVATIAGGVTTTFTATATP